MADPAGRAYFDDAEPEHRITYLGDTVDVDARCTCGWRSSLYPSRLGAQQAADRHLAAQQQVAP